MRRLVLVLGVAACRFNFDPAMGDGAPPGGDACASCAPVVAVAGSFLKPASITGSQTITHGLGVMPKLLVLFTTGDGQVAASHISGLGLVDQFYDARAIGASSLSGVSVSKARRELEDAAITLVDTSGTIIGEATISSWDTSTFHLRWNVESAMAQEFQFLAIGGPGVASRVLRWQAPTAPASLNVGGAGFQPSAVLHAHAGHGFVSAPPAGDVDAALGIGVMEASGGQWSAEITSIDTSAMADTQRGQKEGSALFTFFGDLSPTKLASLTSMSADGFTMSFSIANSFATQLSSLAIGGVRAKAACADKPTTAAPAMQTISVGFEPVAVLLSSVQDIVRPAAVPHARWTMGFATAGGASAAALTDEDGAQTTAVTHRADTSAMLAKADNSAGTVDARAALAGFSSDGFALVWNPNDAVATQFCFLAIGAP